MNILEDMMLIKSESVNLTLVDDDATKCYFENCTYNIYWDDGFGRYVLITQGKFASYHPKYNELLKEVAEKNDELFKDFDDILMSPTTPNKMEFPIKKGKQIIILEKDISENIEELKKTYSSNDEVLKQFLERQLATKYEGMEVFDSFDNFVVTENAILISVFDE